MSKKVEIFKSKQPVCPFCKHLRAGGKCAAFPKGIPDEIASGDNPHTEPLKGQKNKIVFESEFDGGT